MFSTVKSHTYFDICLVFPVFDAASGSIAVLPLAFILTVTAIKDAVEDYRRAQLDEEVNTSAVTRLGGGFRNYNQPKDPRSFWEKLIGVPHPSKVTKGVRKLREREAGEAGANMRIMLHRTNTSDTSGFTNNYSESSFELPNRGAGGRRLDDIQSIDSHSYPPADSSRSFSDSSTKVGRQVDQFGSMSSYSVNNQQPQKGNTGVIDWKRHANGTATWERTLWKKLEVGDIVLLHDNEQVPADIVVLATSDPDGMCYLETKNLDGETNLKPRKAVKATMNISSEEDIERSSFYLDSEPPHQNLYLYHGVLRYKEPSSGERRSEPVSINELLLRGCMLRNTSWIVGLVVFTGSDTKIMLNGGETPSKRSKIEKETNFNVIVNFCVLTLMCTIAAIFNGLQDARTGTSAQFFEAGSDATDSHVLNAIITFVYVPFSCLILSLTCSLDHVSLPSKTLSLSPSISPSKSSRPSRHTSFLRMSTCTTKTLIRPVYPRPGTFPTTLVKSSTSFPTKPALSLKTLWNSKNALSTV